MQDSVTGFPSLDLKIKVTFKWWTLQITYKQNKQREHLFWCQRANGYNTLRGGKGTGNQEH